MTGFAVMCSGQGEQRLDMFQNLTDRPEAAALLARLRPALPAPVAAWLDRPDAETLFADAVCQPLICLRQLLVWEIVRTAVPAPDAFFGYSLGELASYGCAGAFAPETVISLAAERARLMDMAAAAAPSGLAAVKGLPEKPVAAITARHHGFVAIVDGPEHFTVGAPIKELDGLVADFTDAGASAAVRLHVPLASHTPFLAAASQTFLPILENAPFAAPQAALFAGISGDGVFTRTGAASALSRQISEPLRFDLVIEAAVARGCRTFLELGPGTTLSHLILEAHPGLEARSVDEFADLGHVGRWVAAALSRQ